MPKQALSKIPSVLPLTEDAAYTIQNQANELLKVQTATGVPGTGTIDDAPIHLRFLDAGVVSRGSGEQVYVWNESGVGHVVYEQATS